MKKRNHKTLLEKDFIRLNKEIERNWDEQRSLGWVELDEPIHKGYTIKLVLRNDISNREDAWIFEELIEKYGICVHTNKKRQIYEKNYKGYYPRISQITEQTYNDFIPQVKKWFNKSYEQANSWRAQYYFSNIPTFFFEYKIEKHYITRIRVIDSILLQEEDELWSELNRNHYNKQKIEHNAPRAFRNRLIRNHRRMTKKVIHNYIYNNSEMTFDDNFKNANWLWY